MNFNFSLPTKLILKSGALDELSSLKFPSKKALIMTGGESVKKFGYLSRLAAQLKAANVSSVLYDKILQNPISDHVDEAASVIRSEKCGFIIALGGGSVIDSAKAAAVTAAGGGMFWDYVQSGSGKKIPLKKKPLPIVVISTTAGTGSEVNPFAVISKSASDEKTGYYSASIYPHTSVIDPSLTLSLPPSYTAYQGFDAMFHAIESYLNINANGLSDVYAEKAIALIAANLPNAVKDPTNLIYRENLCFANILAGFTSFMSGCISCHALAQGITSLAPNMTHGESLIMIANAYYSYLLEKGAGEERFKKLAHLLSPEGSEGSKDFLSALNNLFVSAGADNLAMSVYGIKKDDFSKITELAENYLGALYFGDPVEISSKTALKILEKAYK